MNAKKHMNRRDFISLTGALGLAPFLWSCGGSGGGSGGSSSSDPTPVAQAQTVNPMSTLSVPVPTVQSGDTYSVSWSGITRSVTPIISDATHLLVAVPPIIGTASSWNGGALTLTVNRTRGGQTSVIATQNVNVNPMQPSPLASGGMIRVAVALAERFREENGTTVFPKTGAAYVSANQTLFGPIGLGSIGLTANEYATLEGLLYTAFTEAGIDMSGLPKAATAKSMVSAKAALPDWSSLDLGIRQIAENMSANAKASAKTLETLGAVVGIAGAAVSSTPLIAIGAVAVGVGVLYGMSEGLILDNAAKFGGLDSDTRLNWQDTVKNYVSSISSTFFDDAISGYTNIAGTNAQNRVSGFFLDLAKSNVTDKLGDAFVNATSTIIKVADDFTGFSRSQDWTTPDAAGADDGRTSISSSGAIPFVSDPFGINAADTAATSTSGGQTPTCAQNPYYCGPH